MKWNKYEMFGDHSFRCGVPYLIGWRHIPFGRAWSPLLTDKDLANLPDDIRTDRFFSLFNMWVEGSLDLIDDVGWQSSGWRSIHPTQYHLSVVHTVLASEKAQPKEEMLERFTTELMGYLDHFCMWVNPPPNKPFDMDKDGRLAEEISVSVNVFEDLAEDGMLWLDNRVALFIEKEFKQKKLAETIKAKARKRFAKFIKTKVLKRKHFLELFLWWDRERRTSRKEAEGVDWAKYHMPRYVFHFATILWRTEFQPQLEQQRSKLPAIALPIAKQINKICFEPGREVRANENRGELISVRGEVLAQIPTDCLPGFQGAFRQLSSLTGHRTIRFLIKEGHRQAAEKIAEPHIIDRPGGLTAFAETIGANSRKAIEEVGQVLLAGSHLRITWQSGEWNGLWIYGHESKEGPGKRSWIRLELASFFMPYFALRRMPSDQRQLVPLVPLPPFVGSPQLHAAQAALQFSMVASLVAHRTELLTYGGALFGPGELERLAKESGLDAAHLPRVLDRWTQDGDDGPKFLERIEKDRYMLANNPHYADERAFILEASRRSMVGQEAGRKSVKNKAQRIERGFSRR